MLVCVCSSEEQRVRSVAAFVERPAAAGHTLLKRVCFVVLRETGTAGAGVAEILWADFFFEMGEVSLKSQHIAMSERVFIRMTSGAVSRARLRSSFFYPPLPPLQGCS